MILVDKNHYTVHIKFVPKRAIRKVCTSISFTVLLHDQAYFSMIPW